MEIRSILLLLIQAAYTLSRRKLAGQPNLGTLAEY